MRIVVVGAGVVGASVGYHLARAGAEVTVLEASRPASGVTGDSFGWIGEPGGADPVDASTALRRTALVEYRRLEEELPGLPVRWCRSLTWGSRTLPAAADLGTGERLVGADVIRRLEPHLRQAPPTALLATNDGAVEPVAVTAAMLAAARARGAAVYLDRPVTALRLVAGRVVGADTADGFLPADRVVLAAGTATAVLSAPLGTDLPVHTSPALLLRFDAPPGLVRTVVSGPDLEVREVAPGRLLAAEEHRGETTADELRRRGEAVRGRLRAYFSGAEAVRLTGVRVGARPMPADGLPLVGPLPGHPEVHAAVMHSAVTLAPAVGRLVAAELVGDTPAPELQGLRPGRAAPAPGQRDQR